MNRKLFLLCSIVTFLPILFIVFYFVFDPKIYFLIARDNECEKVATIYIEALFNRDLETLKKYSIPGKFESDYKKSIEEVYDRFNIDTIKQLRIIETGQNTNTKNGSTSKVFTAWYEVKCENQVYAVNVTFDQMQTKKFVANLKINLLAKPVDTLVSLRSISFSFNHILLFSLGLVTLFLSFFAAKKVYNNEESYKKISYLGILIGIFAITANLNTGKMGFQLLTFKIPTLNIVKQGNIGNWNMAVSVPIYAIIVLIKKPKKVIKNKNETNDLAITND
jgi:hypothetical protein